MNEKELFALEFALKKHENQKRKNTNLPYIIHPLNVYFILKNVTSDSNVLIAGLLHDVLEDTNTSFNEIEKKFNKKIASLVLEVTKNEKKQFNIKSREGLMIKLADILHNISNSKNKKYIAEKLEYVSKLNSVESNSREEVLEYLSDAKYRLGWVFQLFYRNVYILFDSFVFFMSKVLIASLYSVEPVLLSVTKLSVDKLVLLIDLKPNKIQSSALKTIKDSLGKVLEVKSIKTRVYDVVSVAEKCVEVIDLLNNDDEVFVNITGGRKTVALGLLFASYARINKIKKIAYNPEGEKTVVFLPKLSFKLTESQKTILNYLNETKINSISELSNELDLSKAMVYRAIDELKDLGFINVDNGLTLTQAGKIARLWKKLSLDLEKQKALDFDGSVLVTANPGTGKTFLLSRKFVELVKSGVSVGSVLCLTFTNKARGELEDRIVSLLEKEGVEFSLGDLNVFTFHSFALEYLGESKLISSNLLRFVIYEFLKEKQVFSYGDEYLVSDVVPRLENLLRYLKSYGVTPNKIDREKVRGLIESFERSSDVVGEEDLVKFLDYFVEIFELYELEKSRKGIDYADLLINFLGLKNKPLFDFVLIDELQDVNELEARIALSVGKNFFAVGDKKQAIFGFQGGSISNFELFESKKPLIQNLVLNRRSTQEILDYASNYFITNSSSESSKRELVGLKSFEDKHGEKVKVISASRDDWVGKTISLLNELKENQVAVVVRTNQQLMELGKELNNRGVGFSSTFVSSSIEAKKNIVLFLKAVFSDCVDDLKNAFFTPFYPVSLKKAFELTARKKISLKEILDETPSFKKIRENQESLESINELFKTIIFPTSILYGEEYLLAAQSMLDSCQEALTVLNEKTLENLVLYLESSDLMSSTAKKDAKIILTTVHKAKGLEYDNVIYVPKKTKNKKSFYDYIVEKILEANNQLEKTELEEEPIRIDFVAFTRAKKRLYIITESPKNYLNQYSEKREIESENIIDAFEEKNKKAFNLFLNKEFDKAKELLNDEKPWLINHIKKHFKELDRISFSKLKTNAYDYFTDCILELQQPSYALTLGSKVHDLLHSYLEGEKIELNEETKPFVENAFKIIKEIKKQYPIFVKAEHKLKIPLNQIIETNSKLYFKAYLDAIFKNNSGEYLIIDWKTSKNTKNQSTYRRQLELYKRAYSKEKKFHKKK